MPSSFARRSWWRIALVLGLLAFLELVDRPERTRLWSAVFDAGHVPLFALLTLLVRGLVPARTLWGRDLSAFAVAVALGGGAEILQAFQPGREPSLIDLMRDAVAAGAVLLLARAWNDRPRSWRKAAAGALLVVASLSELAFVAAAYVQQARALPVLVRFDGSWWERDIVGVPTGNQLTWPSTFAWPALSGPVELARLDLMPATYSGISIDEPYGDWRGYKRLVVTIGSDLPQPIALALRIHDARHDNRYRDRFNVVLNIVPGLNRIAIPLEKVQHSLDLREMDISRVRSIMLFVYELKQPTHLFLGEMRLE